MLNLTNRYLPLWFYIGTIMVLSVIVGVVLKIEFFLRWATPIFWTGYILLVDGIIFSFKGKSFVFFSGFPVIVLLSICVWWFFEWMNIFISNWHYTGLPELVTRYLGYFWAFGTIVPGVLVTYGLLLFLFRDIRVEFRSFKVNSKILTLMIVIGFCFLLLPIVPFSLLFVERSADPELFFWIKWFGNLKYSEYMAFAVWTFGFLILDPINYLMQKPSVIGYIEKGNYKVVVLLSLTGIICGILWETVNWFAESRWFYTVPILGDIKIFEMPVLGYFGFITFVWEIYDIVSFIYKPAIIRVQEWFV